MKSATPAELRARSWALGDGEWSGVQAHHGGGPGPREGRPQGPCRLLLPRQAQVVSARSQSLAVGEFAQGGEPGPGRGSGAGPSACGPRGLRAFSPQPGALGSGGCHTPVPLRRAWVGGVTLRPLPAAPCPSSPSWVPDDHLRATELLGGSRKCVGEGPRQPLGLRSLAFCSALRLLQWLRCVIAQSAYI